MEPQICEGRGFSWWARIVTGPCRRKVEWASRVIDADGSYFRYLCAKHSGASDTVTSTALIPWDVFALLTQDEAEALRVGSTPRALLGR